MKTVIVALLVALAASAGACWFYVDALESDLRAFVEEIATKAQRDGVDLTSQYESVFGEDWDHALDERLDEARDWTWRHAYPRLVVYTFLCALVTARLGGRLAPEEPA